MNEKKFLVDYFNECKKFLNKADIADTIIDAKKVRVMAAFKRNQKSKTTSRFLTNEFIKEIA